VRKHDGNKLPDPRFPVGCLVRIVSGKGISPEGFRRGGSGFSVDMAELDEGDVGIIVKPPGVRYTKTDPGGDIMSWVLVRGEMLEVPHFHLRSVQCSGDQQGAIS